MTQINDIGKLFSMYCPIIFFQKDEPFMPCNFDEIINRSIIRGNNNVILNETTPLDYVKNNWNNNIKLIDIIPDKKNITPEETRKIGNQIICKTNGSYYYDNTEYLDLVYIVTFTWNGTKEPHPFDKEEIVVRLYRPQGTTEIYNVKRVFGSAHGNGLWYDVTLDKFKKGYVRLVSTIENNQTIAYRPVMFSACESHAMYQHARINKRIFSFGNDVTGMDIRWEPNQFVVIYDNEIKLFSDYDANGQKIFTLLNDNLEHFRYKGLIGGMTKHQYWPSDKPYDTINLDGYYKFDGGITNLFTGRYTQVDKKTRALIFTIALATWVLFFGNLIFKEYIDFNLGLTSKLLFSTNIIINIILSLLLLIIGTYIGLEALILNGPDLL